MIVARNPTKDGVLLPNRQLSEAKGHWAECAAIVERKVYVLGLLIEIRTESSR
jgi:hypothetical protein